MVVCKPILVFSLSLGQAEQKSNGPRLAQISKTCITLSTLYNVCDILQPALEKQHIGSQYSAPHLIKII